MSFRYCNIRIGCFNKELNIIFYSEKYCYLNKNILSRCD